MSEANKTTYFFNIERIAMLEALLRQASYGALHGGKKGDSEYATWGKARALLGCSPTGDPMPKPEEHAGIYAAIAATQQSPSQSGCREDK